jgi:hypothetical protein
VVSKGGLTFSISLVTLLLVFMFESNPNEAPPGLEEIPACSEDSKIIQARKHLRKNFSDKPGPADLVSEIIRESLDVFDSDLEVLICLEKVVVEAETSCVGCERPMNRTERLLLLGC